MAVDLAVSPHATPWAWRAEDQSVPGPVSPTLRGQDLNDFGTFMPPMRSFHLEGETPLRLPVSVGAQRTTPPPPARSGGAGISTLFPSSGPSSSSAGQSPLQRSPQGLLQPTRYTPPPPVVAPMERLIEQHYEEMDRALEQQQGAAQHAQPGASSSVVPHGQPLALFPHGSMMRLSGEEQAWLDHEFDMADMAMESDAEAASHTGSLWSDESPRHFYGQAEDEAEEGEETFVARLLASHPQLNVEEAKWLYMQERSQRQGGMETG